MRLCQPPDGSTSPKYKLLHFNNNDFFYQELNELAFDWDTCCHLVICLRLIASHYVTARITTVKKLYSEGSYIVAVSFQYLGQYFFCPKSFLRFLSTFLVPFSLYELISSFVWLYPHLLCVVKLKCSMNLAIAADPNHV